MTGDISAAQREGIMVGGKNYFFMHCEEGRSVYGRKGANAGLCVTKTKKAILIGIYGPGIQQENCKAVIVKLANYLIQHDL